MAIRNRKLEETEFFRQREEVLSHWPTGKEVELAEGIEYQRRILGTKNAVRLIDQAEKEGKTLVESRGGFATLDHQVALNRCLQEVGCGILPASIDTYTRNSQFERAQQGLEESLEVGRSMLNGFPVVCHGLHNARSLIDSVDMPTLVRATGADNRLLWEIALASGFTGGPGNGFSYYGSGCKSDAWETIASSYQYIDRLVGYYEENGIPIYRESHGVNVRALLPPSLYNAFSILISLQSAEQGVKHLGPCSPVQGCVIQDVAACQALNESTREYLDKYGYSDVKVYRVMNEWGGAFPQDEAKAYAVICFSAAVAALAGVTVVINKSPQEGIGVPTKESNAAGVEATRSVLEMFRGQTFPGSAEVELEKEMIKVETSAIVDKVMELGDGDILIGAKEAFAIGVLDVPFSPNISFADRVLAARDHTGAVRYMDQGSLPFSPEIVEFHREKLAERAKVEGRDLGIDMIIEDAMAGIMLKEAATEQPIWEARRGVDTGVKKKTVVAGVIGMEDPHVIGHKLLCHALRSEGFNVVSLGAKTEPKEFVEAAIETAADAILVGSMAGHGEMNCRQFKEMCEETGLQDVILCVGGNLVVGQLDWDYVEKVFKDMGFDRVYPPGADIPSIIRDLKADLHVSS